MQIPLPALPVTRPARRGAVTAKGIGGVGRLTAARSPGALPRDASALQAVAAVLVVVGVSPRMSVFVAYDEIARYFVPACGS